MNCLFCGNELIDATLPWGISISKNCEFAYYWCDFLLHYYVCVNRKIAIVNNGWMSIIKKQFFTKGTFIPHRAFEHKEFEMVDKAFLERGFVF